MVDKHVKYISFNFSKYIWVRVDTMYIMHYLPLDDSFQYCIPSGQNKASLHTLG